MMRTQGWMVVVIVVMVGSGVVPVDTPVSGQASLGEWLYVGGSGPGNYTTIQDAIDVASPGDTVFVYQGWYDECLLINKSISVLGQDRNMTVITGGNATSKSTQIMVFIVAPEVMFSEFTVQQTHAGSYLGIGGISCSESQIKNSVVRGCRSGIAVQSCNSVMISKNIIQNCTTGIGITQTVNGVVMENTVEGVGDESFGICVQLTQHKNTVTRNTIKNCSRGVYLIRASFTAVTKNAFIWNAYQATFSDSYCTFWLRNYWNESRLLPKVIHGWAGGSIHGHHVINIDWLPAVHPLPPRIVR